MINDNVTFYSYIGEIIMFCQKIEHDVKLLSAAVSPHGYKVGLEILKEDKTTLGQALTMLRDFDNLQKIPYFSDVDYKALWRVNGIRNFYAHQCFQELLYVKGEDNRKAAMREMADKVEQDHKALEVLSDRIEKTRINYFKTHNYKN